jgi:hypothetical protein
MLSVLLSVTQMQPALDSCLNSALLLLPVPKVLLGRNLEPWSPPAPRVPADGCGIVLITASQYRDNHDANTPG